MYYTVRRDNHYDYYVYAQQWPAALCKKINETHHGKCAYIPKNVDTWVVHGLWPSKAHTAHYGPFNCEDLPFDAAKLYPIRERLNAFWPNLMQDKADSSFWVHEWDKHGTCACQKHACTELEYFTQGLELRDALNFDKKLAAKGITPSASQTYALDRITSALGPGKYQCYKTEKSADFQVIAQIETCHDLGYDQVDCADYADERDNNTLLPIFHLVERLVEGADCDPESYTCGPYNPGSCSNKLPVKIFPAHMPMEV